MTAPFGRDEEPEDAWDLDDSRKEHIDNLLRRLHLLNPTIRIRTWLRSPDTILNLIEFHVLDLQRRGGLTPREQLRIEHMLDDIEVTREQ